MSYDNTINIKTFFFQENGKVLERLRDGSINERTKESVIAEIRKRKQDKDIKNYQINPSDGLNIYQIALEEGNIQLHLKSNCIENIFLKTILQSQKIARDEVTVLVEGQTYRMTSRNASKEKTGRDMSHMLEILNHMQNNHEIERVIKTGKNTLAYTFETTDNEKIRIIVDSKNNEVVKELDEFSKITLKKKKRLKTLLTASALGLALAVSSPYIGKNIHNFLTVEEQTSNTFDVETNFKILHSYAIRLTTGELNIEEYDAFKEMTSKMIQHYEENGKLGNDYATLLRYQDLINEHYTEMKGRSY